MCHTLYHTLNYALKVIPIFTLKYYINILIYDPINKFLKNLCPSPNEAQCNSSQISILVSFHISSPPKCIKIHKTFL